MASGSKSTRKGRLGLLISVRYQNPIPPPPYPPKLIDIPSNVGSYGSAEYNATISQGRAQDVMVDAQGGMPVQLATYDGMFDYDADKSAWCPDLNQEELAQLEPEDAALFSKAGGAGGFDLGDASIGANGFSAGQQVLGAAPGAAKDMIKGTGRAEVSWLRRTQYLSNQPTSRFGTGATTSSAGGLSSQDALDAEPDISRDAQIGVIERSFTAANTSLRNLVHPTKSSITPVETYPLLPDATVWGHPFRIIRLPENPSDRRDETALDDIRPEHALFQPVQDEDGSRYMSYYLPVEAEGSTKLEALRTEVEEATRKGIEAESTTDDEEKAIEFRWVRDYDYVKLPAEIESADYMSEVFFGLREGDPSQGERKGLIAFYGQAEGRYQLKKRRVRRDGILSIQKSSNHIDRYQVYPRPLGEADREDLRILAKELMTEGARKESQTYPASEPSADQTAVDE